MRTNIFITNQSVKTTFVDNLDSLDKDLGFVKATSNGNLVDKNFNLVFKELTSKYYNIPNRETRIIPVSACNLKVTENSIDFVKLNKGECVVIIDNALDVTDLIGEDVGIRVIIPTIFNGRNSWNFSYRVKYGDTAENVLKSLYGQIIASSIKEYLDIDLQNSYPNGQVVTFYTNAEHNAIYCYPMDSMPPSAIVEDPGITPKPNIKEFINKLIIDADANYGFDYVNCPEGDFYPNKLTYRQIEKLLFEYATGDGEGNHAIGLTHITFNEPRIIETTGDVVNQVINIIHPLEDMGNFVKDDYDTMISLISE